MFVISVPSPLDLRFGHPSKDRLAFRAGLPQSLDVLWLQVAIRSFAPWMILGQNLGAAGIKFTGQNLWEPWSKTK